MNRRFRAGGSHRHPGIVLVAVLVAGCASTTPTPSPSVAPPTAAPPSLAASIPAGPSAAPSASSSAPASSAAPSASATIGGGSVSGFTTTPPLAEGAAWTSIAWQPLAAGDPLASVTDMVRVPSGGWVAWANPVALTPTTSASPAWSSTDGATWNPLPAGTFGPAGVIVALGPLKDRLLALTMTGGANSCSDNPIPSCWTLAGPLHAWTSTDGAAWTPATAPSLELPMICDDCGSDVPGVAFGGPGALVFVPGPGDRQMSLTGDGTTWTGVPANALPRRFQFARVDTFGNQLVAVGDDGRSPARAEVATSTDGVAWHPSILPDQKHPDEGADGQSLLAGAKGVLVDGSTQDVPGRALSWSSTDLATWHNVGGYAPLGVWTGEGEGSGLLSDGVVAADGQRLLAFTNDGRVKSWTSTDGRTWTVVPSTGLTAQAAHSWPDVDLSLLPVGALMKDQAGASWLGVPSS